MIGRRVDTPLQENRWQPLSQLLGAVISGERAFRFARDLDRESLRLRRVLGLRDDPLQLRPAAEGVEIRASGIAGTLTIGGLTIDVAPKFAATAVSNEAWQAALLAVLERARRRHFTYSTVAKIGSRPATFVDHMGMAYADAIERGLAAEAIHTYRMVEEEAPVLRGRLNVGRQMRSLVSRPHLLACDVDSLSGENRYNQFLDWALARFAVAVRDPALKHRLSDLRIRLPATTPRTDRPPIVDSNPPPQYQIWRDALEIAALLATGGIHSPERGVWTGFGFVLGMERLFERFVQESLRACLPLLECDASVVPQDAQAYAYPEPPGKQRYFSRPDNVLYIGTTAALIVDAKYKRFTDAEGLSTSKPTNADIYELVAAMTAHKCDRGLLVYPRLADDLVLADGRMQTWTIASFGSPLRASAVAVNMSALSGERGIADLDSYLAGAVDVCLSDATS